MIIKFYDLNKFLRSNINFYLLYGPNMGLIEETIDKTLKPNFSKNIYNYDESEVIADIDKFKEGLLNKSFFENEKLIIINRVTDKILKIIEEIVEKNIEDLKIILKSGILEKRSKIRNFFEKNKNVIIVPFYEDTIQTLTLFAKDYLNKKKIKISSENINIIIEKSKMNRMNLKIELEKIANFSNGKRTINKDDIYKLTNSLENLNISELTDMCLSKNKKRTLNLLNDNIFAQEDYILFTRNFLYKIKRLKILKEKMSIDNNVETVVDSYKPNIFWKDKETIKKQLNILSLEEIESLIVEINELEYLIKKNAQISNLLFSNFIFETINQSNS